MAMTEVEAISIVMLIHNPPVDSVSDLLTDELQVPIDPPVRFPTADLRELYGALTVRELAERVETVVLLRCGKLHEEEFTPFKSCPNFSANLLCGHCGALRESKHQSATLRSAASLIATALRVSHAAGALTDLPSMLEQLHQLSAQLHAIDGGAFIAFREISNPGYYSYSFIPKIYRRPEWEKLSIPDLRSAIREAEGELEPQAQRILSVARSSLREIIR